MDHESETNAIYETRNQGWVFFFFLLGRALLDMSPVSPLSTSLSSLFHVLN